VEYSYDEPGERTKRIPTTGQATTYGYDQGGNLTSVTRPKEGETPAIEDSYGYDGSGLRASQTAATGTSYAAWDPTEGLPVILNDGINSYIYGPNALPVEQIGAGESVLYLHHDQQGSSRLLTGATGASEGTTTYDGYGNRTGASGTATTSLGWDGQYTSSNTGFIYLRARTYDPATAQFLSVDPAGPITRAPYTYAGDNPLSGRDNRGLDIELGFVSIPTPNLEEVGNFAAGFGDTLTFGATQWAREELGINNVDTCSTAYQAGGYGGLATGVLIPGEGEVLGAGDLAAGAIRERDVLGSAERWLGEGYREVAPGVYRSADDARQFRATPSDLGAAQPHVHFESVGPGGRGNTENAHVYLGEW
jgi:RHS repeat-associated protein